jgi:hypothetical protein
MLPGDIQHEAFCVSMIDRAVEEFGRLDVLVKQCLIPADVRRD